ncbi:hypothetical protein DSO57_1014613 [Entomophthora muscae]|uniref:Uncharacterized protein n=1 Tax=Entomophthora muscae TaxID=34485 RepID=A0ACC2UQ60_9FUNG|nr:hypothetical protein DSO57_1014613 [Entomophthora muscae]
MALFSGVCISHQFNMDSWFIFCPARSPPDLFVHLNSSERYRTRDQLNPAYSVRKCRPITLGRAGVPAAKSCQVTKKAAVRLGLLTTNDQANHCTQISINYTLYYH